MAQYKTDLQDIFFNLCDYLKVQDHIEGYGLSDIRTVVEEFDKFVANEAWSARALGDKEGVRLQDGQVITPDSYKILNQRFFENGWYGLGYAEDIGGIWAPHSVTMGCLALLTGANTAYSIFIELTRGAQNIFLKLGSERQKQLFVPKMMSGQWSGTMCLTEAGAGSDVGNLRTLATPMGDGRYKIKGVKLFISAGENDLYENIIHLVLAKTPGAPEGTKGISLFAVPKYRVHEDGSLGEFNDVRCSKIEEKMGIHASPTCELVFGEQDECMGEIIGNECEGMANMFLMMNEVRLYCGVQGESQASLTYQMTKEYATERVQFKSEIANHPDVKRMLLKMRASARGMRAFNFYAAHLFDLEEKGQDTSAEIALLTPIGKAYCTDEGFNVTVDAIQVHGGYGYCTEYGIEQFLRDSKIATIYEGTNGIQALDFVTRKILKDQGKAMNDLMLKMIRTAQHEQTLKWKEEVGLLKFSIEKLKELLDYYGLCVQKKNMSSILGSSADFLNYVAHTVVAWLLLEQAICADEKLTDTVDDEEKEFLMSKIVDFKVYVHHYLTKNAGLFQSIKVFHDDWDHWTV